MLEKLDNDTRKEAESYIACGMKIVTIRQYNAAIKAMGFKLDRNRDCASVAQCMSTGRRYRSITSCARQILTGVGFANVACDRGEGWLHFMAYRRGHFCIVRGSIFTV